MSSALLGQLLKTTAAHDRGFRRYLRLSMVNQAWYEATTEVLKSMLEVYRLTLLSGEFARVQGIRVGLAAKLDVLPMPAKRDMQELRALRRPPQGVVHVISAALSLAQGRPPPCTKYPGDEEKIWGWALKAMSHSDECRETFRACVKKFPASWEEDAWGYANQLMVDMEPAGIVENMNRKSKAAAQIAQWLVIAYDNRHALDDVGSETVELLDDTIEKLPMLEAIVRIKTVPGFQLLRTSKNEVPWAQVCRNATAEDVHTLRWLSTHKGCTNRAKEQLEKAVARLEA